MGNPSGIFKMGLCVFLLPFHILTKNGISLGDCILFCHFYLLCSEWCIITDSFSPLLWTNKNDVNQKKKAHWE